jgi:exportin-5
MISVLGNCVEDKYPDIPQDLNFADILGLLLTIVQNQSLVVSIPVLVTWSRMLRVEIMSEDPALPPLVAPLLEVCSSRLIRYENLPEDFDDPSMIFLLDDIDTIPERHAFLGNYRRYSISVIESIVHEFQNEAIPYILNRAGNLLGNLYVESGPFQAETYSKSSLQLLKVEAQFGVVEAAVKQYMKWRDTPRMNEGTPGTLARERATLENLFETWCNQLLEMRFEDPLIRKKALQLAVAFSTSALDTKPGFMLRVLEHILTTQMPERPEHQAYSDAVKELQIESVNDLRRLAIKIPDQVFAVYDQLAAKVDEITQAGVDPKQALGYQSFLFTIIHRTSSLDIPARVQRLQPFIDPVKQAWQNAELDAALSSFTNFCDALYVTKCRDYIVQHRVHEVSDWSKLPLDDNGQAIQAELNDRIRALPLRMSKGFLGCSTEKVKKDSPAYEVSCRLWHDAVPLILPNLLKFLSHAHAFHNPANWAGLPSEMSPIVGRILTDRFWQAGISEGSKDDFYARVVGTKSTMEGLASSIRASVRAVRDSCYSIIFCLSRLERYFYGFAELPGPLAHAIFADAHCLSSHQLINLLNLVKYLIDECPVDLRNHFMPPLLAACFTQLDAKISSEWEKLDQKLRASAQDDDLTEEMKEESSLRQLTHSAVILVAAVLDPMPARSEHDEEPKEPMRRFCLSNSSILEPLILFSTHAIRMRDTRCCSVVLRIFRSLIPEFRKPDSQSSSIREFISNDVLKACISSLHEPYFVDLQKELATLIASILTHYCPLTETPRQVLLALPGIHEKSVNKCIDYVSRPAMQNRQQAALVLDLLRDLKGVSISEQGRITKSGGVVRKELSKMQKEFMKTNLKEEPLRKEPSPDLEGVAGMFDA